MKFAGRLYRVASGAPGELEALREAAPEKVDAIAEAIVEASGDGCFERQRDRIRCGMELEDDCDEEDLDYFRTLAKAALTAVLAQREAQP